MLWVEKVLVQSQERLQEFDRRDNPAIYSLIQTALTKHSCGSSGYEAEHREKGILEDGV